MKNRHCFIFLSKDFYCITFSILYKSPATTKLKSPGTLPAVRAWRHSVILKVSRAALKKKKAHVSHECSLSDRSLKLSIRKSLRSRKTREASQINTTIGQWLGCVFPQCSCLDVGSEGISTICCSLGCSYYQGQGLPSSHCGTQIL